MVYFISYVGYNYYLKRQHIIIVGGTSIDGRVVKATDLRSVGKYPRGFDPRSMHQLFCQKNIM